MLSFPYYLEMCYDIYIIYFVLLKAFVDMEQKDDKYWEKRGKNNVAARRSREARRLKENQIALRTAYLEKQNYGLKSALQDVNMKNEKLALEKKILMEKLQKYELMASAFLEWKILHKIIT